MTDAYKKARASLKPRDLHFRPECDDYKCGAHKSWEEGYDAGYAQALSSPEVMGLITAVSHARGAMVYAYDDHSDQYYLNVKDQMEKALAAFEKAKGEK